MCRIGVIRAIAFESYEQNRQGVVSFWSTGLRTTRSARQSIHFALAPTHNIAMQALTVERDPRARMRRTPSVMGSRVCPARASRCSATSSRPSCMRGRTNTYLLDGDNLRSALNPGPALHRLR